MRALPEGQYVKHFQYGFGWVIESDADRTSIDFTQFGTKKFVTSMMVVEAVGDAPPRPRSKSRRKKTVKSAAKPVPVAQAK